MNHDITLLYYFSITIFEKYIQSCLKAHCFEFKNKMLLNSTAAIMAVPSSSQLSIIHPGTILGKNQLRLLHTQTTGLNALKVQIAKYEATTGTSGAHVIQNVDIGRNGSGVGHAEWTRDAIACYQYVLLFLASNDVKWGLKAITIIKAWIEGCKVFTGANAPLEAAWGIIPIVRSAELLKWHSLKTSVGWGQKIEASLNKFIETLMLPNLRGKRYNEVNLYNNNWSVTVLEAIIQIAIFRDKLADFDWAVREYRKLSPRTYLGSIGQNTDSYRDDYHGLFTMSSHIQIAEMCWHQGVKDLYTDILYKSVEFHAGLFNMHIPNAKDVIGILPPYKWPMPCVWEVAYNHYVNLKKKSMPETLLVLKKRRPELSSLCWGPGLTHYNTL